MSSQIDPRWSKLREARVGLVEPYQDDFEDGVDWIEFVIEVEYKDTVVWSRHLADPETIADAKLNMFKEILDMMVEQIDKNLDRVDNGEKAF